jgi:hypothetical protein
MTKIGLRDIRIIFERDLSGYPEPLHRFAPSHGILLYVGTEDFSDYTQHKRQQEGKL